MTPEQSLRKECLDVVSRSLAGSTSCEDVVRSAELYYYFIMDGEVPTQRQPKTPNLALEKRKTDAIAETLTNLYKVTECINYKQLKQKLGYPGPSHKPDSDNKYITFVNGRLVQEFGEVPEGFNLEDFSLYLDSQIEKGKTTIWWRTIPHIDEFGNIRLRMCVL
jgi:hypothetical protein